MKSTQIKKIIVGVLAVMMVMTVAVGCTTDNTETGEADEPVVVPDPVTEPEPEPEPETIDYIEVSSKISRESVNHLENIGEELNKSPINESSFNRVLDDFQETIDEFLALENIPSEYHALFNHETNVMLAFQDMIKEFRKYIKYGDNEAGNKAFEYLEEAILHLERANEELRGED